MKCSSCGQGLDLPEETLIKFTNCPFCGAVLQKNDSESKKSTTIEEELAKIVSDFGGLEIFSEENALRLTKALNLLVAPFDIIRDKLLVACIRHVPQRLYSIKEAPSRERQTEFKTCIDDLCTIGQEESSARDTVVLLSSVIGCAIDINDNEENYFIDSRDNIVYKIVKIGNKMWFAENLRYRCNDSWVYNNDITNEAKLGRLYSWYSANDACPKGWRLPTKEEWEDLYAKIGSSPYALQSTEYSSWQWPGATNSSNFSAIPSGLYVRGDFCGINQAAYFGCATKFDAWIIGYDYARLTKLGYGYGFSIRCVKDVE